jgi:hypothetical protein
LIVDRIVSLFGPEVQIPLITWTKIGHQSSGAGAAMEPPWDLNISGKLFFNALATLTLFTRDIFLTPRSIPC